MKYEAIERMQDEYPVARLCAVLGVSQSGYYAWLKREPCSRAAEDTTLKDKIVSLWQQFRRVYGAPRLYKELLAQRELLHLFWHRGLLGEWEERIRGSWWNYRGFT